MNRITKAIVVILTFLSWIILGVIVHAHWLFPWLEQFKEPLPY